MYTALENMYHYPNFQIDRFSAHKLQLRQLYCKPPLGLQTRYNTDSDFKCNKRKLSNHYIQPITIDSNTLL